MYVKFQGSLKYKIINGKLTLTIFRLFNCSRGVDVVDLIMFRLLLCVCVCFRMNYQLNSIGETQEWFAS